MSAVQLVVGLLLMGGGVAVFPYVAKQNRERREALRWPRVPGTVVHNEVVSLPSANDGETGSRARIRYQYQVQGQTLESDRVQWGMQVIDVTDAGAQALSARYPLGAPVQVWVNPNSPAQCALEIAPAKNAMMTYAFAVALLLVGVVLLAASGGGDAPTSPAPEHAPEHAPATSE